MKNETSSIYFLIIAVLALSGLVIDRMQQARKAPAEAPAEEGMFFSDAATIEKWMDWMVDEGKMHAVPKDQWVQGEHQVKVGFVSLSGEAAREFKSWLAKHETR